MKTKDKKLKLMALSTLAFLTTSTKEINYDRRKITVSNPKKYNMLLNLFKLKL